MLHTAVLFIFGHRILIQPLEVLFTAADLRLDKKYNNF